MSETFDAALYVRAPIINLANGVTLANALVDACPSPAPDNVMKSCGKLRAAADAGQNALAARRREKGLLTEEDSRVLDNEADTSFGALRMRLLAYSMLPASRYPRAKRAAELVAEVFGPEGLSFLTLEYPAQNTMMAAVMQHIHEAGLAADINTIAGPEFLDQITNVLPRYDAMVQEKLQREIAAASNLGELVRALQAAIVDYASKVAALVDLDDPASVALVKKALRPIDAHREFAARRTHANAGKSEQPPPAGKPAETSAKAEPEAQGAARHPAPAAPPAETPAKTKSEAESDGADEKEKEKEKAKAEDASSAKSSP